MPFRIRTVVILLVATSLWPLAAKAAGCGAWGSSVRQKSTQAKHPAPALGVGAHGLDLADIDSSASPCQDFYEFADGGWIRSHSLPAGKASWGVIDELEERNREILRQILEEAAAEGAQAAPGSSDQKLGDFYSSCMNSSAIDAERWRPLAPEFLRIDRIRNLGELDVEVARLQEMGAGALFGFGATKDLTDASQVIAHAYQGGLGLPNPEYYLQDDASDAAIRQQYQAHIARMFELLGEGPGEARFEAHEVLRIETMLAAGWMSRADEADPEATFHLLDIRQLQALTPRFSWGLYFRALAVPATGEIDVSEPQFFQTVDRGLATIPLADWKIYLRWQLIHAYAPDLSRRFVSENFDFYGRALAGLTQMAPRWQNCAGAANRELPAELSVAFVDRTFSPSEETAALAMVHNLIAAFREDLRNLYWLGASSRAAAVAKLDQLNVQVGYASTPGDDSAYRVTAGPFVQNVMAGNRFHFQDELARIGQSSDPSRWPITASASDAFYDPAANAIFLPAGIFQPPFFDPQADDALNYGAIGAVIGHELTHGFDNIGSWFDGGGNFGDWWSPDDRETFHSIAECVADQYDTYVAVGDLHERGHAVLGESIADIGGVSIAYQAFQKTPEFHSRKRIQGFTPAQRFFLAYARMWSEIRDPQNARQSVASDPHAMGKYRVIGPLSDFEPFAEAFRCPEKDAMVRPIPDRCTIW